MLTLHRVTFESLNWARSYCPSPQGPVRTGFNGSACGRQQPALMQARAPASSIEWSSLLRVGRGGLPDSTIHWLWPGPQAGRLGLELCFCHSSPRQPSCVCTEEKNKETNKHTKHENTYNDLVPASGLSCPPCHLDKALPPWRFPSG